MRDPQDLTSRRHRRAVLRAHHPDLGGDPEEFMRQLHALDDPPRADSDVVFVRRRRGLHRVTGWLRDRRSPRSPRVL